MEEQQKENEDEDTHQRKSPWINAWTDSVAGVQTLS